MFHVKTISEDDFAFAVDLTDTMGWNLTEEDFMFMKRLEPKGCFIVLDNSERVGVTTSIGFDTMGWIGNVIIRGDYRGRGAGSLLVRHALSFLKQQVETIGVYAYHDKIPFYQQLGFEYDSDFMVFKGKGVSSGSMSYGREATKTDISEIVALDERCFGASRSKVLEALLLDSGNLCYVAEAQRSLRGFVVAKVYHEGAEVGPLVCREGCSTVAVDLVRAALHRLGGVEVVMCVPAKASQIRDALMRWGLREDFRVARMFYGDPSVGDCVFLAESLERG
jgi:ribosomal protein S18 acetylase RimI-like enzyme